MTKLELLMEFIETIMEYTEHHLSKEFSYQTVAFSYIRDTLRVTDPEDFTGDQLVGLKRLLEKVLSTPQMSRTEKKKVLEDILRMDLTPLPVTDYAEKQIKNKELELHRN